MTTSISAKNNERLAITAEQSLQVWSADGWSCRYCGELVFFPPALRAMARRHGNHGYFHPNWKASEAPLLIRRGASVDHVLAHSRGGAHDAGNFVTACWECNLRKNDCEGWEPRVRAVLTKWDGMLSVFVGLTTCDADESERRWLRAIQTAARR